MDQDGPPLVGGGGTGGEAYPLSEQNEDVQKQLRRFSWADISLAS